ncbi:MAG: phosphotransferase [Pseudomonadota bacterium]
MTRATRIDDFLTGAGWGEAARTPLAADASTRRYTRLRRGGATVMLMDAPYQPSDAAPGPPYIVGAPGPFLAVTRALRDRGLSAPEVLAADEEAGLLLLEDLGDGIFARLIDEDPTLETPLYAATVDLLAELHAGPACDLPPYDAETARIESAIALDWYCLPSPDRADRAAFLELVGACVTPPSVPVLRDCHAENLIWLPHREGHARVGLLDYQDALMGDPAYDLVSLLEDARRDVADPLREAMLRRYLDRTGAEAATLHRAFAAWGAQRNLKILGIFARQRRRDGRDAYLPLLPRVWAHLQRDLAHPDLAALRTIVERIVPPPSAAHIDALRSAR